MRATVSAACRPADKRRRRGEIGSVHRSTLVGHRSVTQSVLRGYTEWSTKHLYNSLKPVVISKQLEWIGRSVYILAWSIATALHSDINQTAGSGGHLNTWENRCMRVTVCLLRASRRTRAGDAAKSGQFIGQLSWVTGYPIGLKGLNCSNSIWKWTFWQIKQ